MPDPLPKSDYIDWGRGSGYQVVGGGKEGHKGGGRGRKHTWGQEDEEKWEAQETATLTACEREPHVKERVTQTGPDWEIKAILANIFRPSPVGYINHESYLKTTGIYNKFCSRYFKTGSLLQNTYPSNKIGPRPLLPIGETPDARLGQSGHEHKAEGREAHALSWRV